MHRLMDKIGFSFLLQFLGNLGIEIGGQKKTSYTYYRRKMLAKKSGNIFRDRKRIEQFSSKINENQKQNVISVFFSKNFPIFIDFFYDFPDVLLSREIFFDCFVKFFSTQKIR